MSLSKSRFIEMFGNPNTNSLNLPEKPIKNVCQNLDYKREPITSSERVKGKYPYYGASGIVDWVDNFIFDDDLLLVSEDGENLSARVTPIAFSIKGKTWVNNHAHVLKFNDLYMQNYVEYFFNQLDLTSKITGTAQPKFNQKALNETMLPIPSIESLVHFKNLCNQIDKSKFLLQKILEKLELLKKSRFIELFGSTDLSLQKDDWVEIKNIGEVVSGSTPKTTNESYWGGENKWITPAELSSNTYVITKTDRYLTDEGVKSCSLRKLPKDTVLLTSRAPIGKVAIAGTEMYCNQGFKNIICNEKIRPKYLFYLLKNNVRYLEYLGRGATFKEISKSIVENVKIPLFPLQDQDRFIEFAEQIDKSKLVIQKSLEDLVGKS